MGTGADLAWLRREAHLPLADAAKALGVGGVELWAFEGRAKSVPDRLFERARKVYYDNQREDPADVAVAEYIPGVDEREACSHHWRIETPSGATSQGRCIRCGSSRIFENSGDYSGRGRGD